LDERCAWFETPPTGLLSIRRNFKAILDLPHPEEPAKEIAKAGVSKDARRYR
jgi:hypothetical protein